LHGIDSMTQTAEHLAREHGIARVDQDAYALRSQQRTARAIAAGHLAAEILPVGACVADEQPRPDTTLAGLDALAPLLGAEGTVTAGNASGLNDGACALLLASEDAVARHGLQPRARVLGMAAAGVPPRTMGLGPVPAIERLLQRSGLDLDAFDHIEINEAFAAQVLACVEAAGSAAFARAELGRDRALGEIPMDLLNVNGGAIALGHPVGASGARLLITLLHEMRRRNLQRGVASLCVGGGQGAAFVLERP